MDSNEEVQTRPLVGLHGAGLRATSQGVEFRAGRRGGGSVTHPVFQVNVAAG